MSVFYFLSQANFLSVLVTVYLRGQWSVCHGLVYDIATVSVLAVGDDPKTVDFVTVAVVE